LTPSTADVLRMNMAVSFGTSFIRGFEPAMNREGRDQA
jgi:hypothetical protein